jgi:hypothetical protein
LSCGPWPPFLPVCYAYREMFRAGHIAVALLGVFLLARPFDCFAAGRFDQKAADCCKKGKCSPSNSDDCCKATVQGDNQLLAPKATGHSLPVLELLMADIPSATLGPLVISSVRVEIYPPPGSLPDLGLHLPLLI